MASDSDQIENKEAIITIVGFLGAGKTTLLKHLSAAYSKIGWSPYVILNDYENALLDAQQLKDELDEKSIKALSGSCICCCGIHELRDFVNSIQQREKGITLIEANGTTDACSLAGFLGVGIKDKFLPPVQLSVVDVKNWQKRGAHNELEANQVQLSSLIILTHVEHTEAGRVEEVTEDLQKINPSARIVQLKELDVTTLPELTPSINQAEKMEHAKAHWSSCSVDLPELPYEEGIRTLCSYIPESILRVKGCTKLKGGESYTYFERTPDGKVSIRPFYGYPPAGSKLLTIGLGSETSVLSQAIDETLKSLDLEVSEV